MKEIWTSTQTLKCVVIILLLVSARLAAIVFGHFMHAVPFGEPSTGPLHPDYVSSVFSLKKRAEKRASSRCARANNFSKLRSVQFVLVRCVTTV